MTRDDRRAHSPRIGRRTLLAALGLTSLGGTATAASAQVNVDAMQTDSLHVTGTNGQFDSEDGIVVIGPEPDVSSSPSNYQFNGEGRGLVVSGNPNNAGLPNGISLFTGDAGDEEGSGFNAGYSTALNFYIDESFNGTAREIGHLAADNEGDFKFYKRNRPLDVSDESTAQPVPIFGSNGTADFRNSGELHSFSFFNCRKVDHRKGSEVDSDEGFDWTKWGGRSIRTMHSDTSGAGWSEMRFNHDDTLGWGIQVGADPYLHFRDFGNGLMPTWDFNGGDGIDVGLPRYSSASDVPAPNGQTHVGWDEGNDRLVIGADGSRYEISTTEL